MNERSLLNAAQRGFLLLACATALVASGCGSSSKSATQNAGNFSTTVFIGDSLTAGYQNGSLLDTQQPNGYANLIAQQAKFTLTLPLIAPPGAPNVMKLVSLGPPPVTTTVPGNTVGRDDYLVQATDLGVPGAFVNDVLNTVPVDVPTTPEQQITQLVIGFPGLSNNVARTQLGWAEALKPTTIFVWIGNNDALVADITGMPASMTPLASFTTQFTQLMTDLSKQTHANLVVANVPDVTTVPYLTPALEVLEEACMEATGSVTPACIAGMSQTLGIQPASSTYAGDLVNPTGLAEVPLILTGKQAPPITDSGFLSAAEVVQVQQMVLSYNQVIQQQASAVGATLVDIHSVFAQAATSGLTVNGYTATFAYLGGLFSLDGIHPTNTGYGVLANAFIDTMNANLKTTIPDVDLAAVAAKDPLWTPNLLAAFGAQPSIKHHISVAAGQSVAWMWPKYGGKIAVQ
jgi:lysophospholipase L1-like esterase